MIPQEWDEYFWEELPDALSSGEVADLIRAKPRTIIKWADKGLIKCFKTLGGHRRFPKEEVLLLLKGEHPIQKEFTR